MPSGHAVGLVAVELRDQRGVGVHGAQPPFTVQFGADRLPHRQPLLVAAVGRQVEARHEAVPGHRLHRRPPERITQSAPLHEAPHETLAQPCGLSFQLGGGRHDLPPPFRVEHVRERCQGGNAMRTDSDSSNASGPTPGCAQIARERAENA